MEKNKTSQILLLVIIVMVIGIGFTTFKLVSLNKNFTELSNQMEETISAKDLIEEDLRVLYSEYDSIQTENTNMNMKLDQEQEKISVLLDELKTVKSYNAQQIKQYRAEIETLRGIMKSYVFQIDSLNQLNNQLIAENSQVRESNEKLKYEIEEVVEHNDQLELTVEKASIVKASNLKLLTFKRKGKQTQKASKVSQLQTVFTLVENSIAEKGSRTVYARIIRPDSHVLSKNLNNLFEYKGSSIAFSESREVQYDGQFLDVVIYYDVEQELLAGEYTVEVYMDDNIIGVNKMTLY